MCRWMGSHFYDWIDYNRGRIFNRVTRMGSHIFGFLGVRLFVIFTVSKRTTIFLLQTESKVVSFNLKNGSIHENRQWKWRLGWRKLHICPKVTKMGSIIGHRIDYNGVGALRGQRHIPSKNWPKYPPGAFSDRNHPSLREQKPYRVCFLFVPAQKLSGIEWMKTIYSLR